MFWKQPGPKLGCRAVNGSGGGGGTVLSFEIQALVWQ
jgi:hypothetical protein